MHHSGEKGIWGYNSVSMDRVDSSPEYLPPKLSPEHPRFAWYGMQFPVPSEWNLAGFTGDRRAGKLTFSDMKSTRLVMWWKTSRKSGRGATPSGPAGETDQTSLQKGNKPSPAATGGVWLFSGMATGRSGDVPVPGFHDILFRVARKSGVGLREVCSGVPRGASDGHGLRSLVGCVWCCGKNSAGGGSDESAISPGREFHSLCGKKIAARNRSALHGRSADAGDIFAGSCREDAPPA